MTAKISNHAGRRALRRVGLRFRSQARRQSRRLRRIRRRLTAHTWIRRTFWVGGVTVGVMLIAVGALWWRLSRGPIEIDIATPWLTAAIAENFGGKHSVTIGGT